MYSSGKVYNFGIKKRSILDQAYVNIYNLQKLSMLIFANICERCFVNLAQRLLNLERGHWLKPM